MVEIWKDIKDYEGLYQIEAGRQLGICHRHINDCCKGRRHTTGGYHWRYIEQGGDYHLYV